MSAKSSIIKSVEMDFKGQQEAIMFVAGSASLNEKESISSQGVLKKQTLTFKIATISLDNDRMASRIRRCVAFRVIDAQGYVSLVGYKAFPPRILIDKVISGSAGGFIGYNVTIEAASL